MSNNVKKADLPPTAVPPARPRLDLPRAQRLKGRRDVTAAYRRGKRRIAHPLAAHTIRRTDNAPSRLGISIGRRCGNAVCRNRIKRLLRESYRHLKQELPIGCDFLIVVRPHQILPLDRYQTLLRQLLR